MALDIDKTKMGRRTSRFGSGPRKSFKGRHSSRGVLPLNQGSSPHTGGKSVMSLGGRGGGFGSGRPAGGGLAAALAGIAPAAPEAAGPAPVAGPPPVDFPILPPAQPFRSTPIFPRLPVDPIDNRTQAILPGGGFPKPLEPEIDPDLVWRLGQMLAF